MYQFKTNPYKHQKAEFEKYKDTKARAMLWQMRTGKSKVIIDTAAYLWSAGKIDVVIILAPNGVHYNWILKEFPDHCPVPWNAYVWRSAGRTKKDRVQELKDFLNLDEMTLGVMAVNTDGGLIVKDAQKALATFIKNKNVMFVADESHYFGKPSTTRTRLARGLAKKCVYRRILTGTAVSNSPLKAFTQYELLEPGALGFKTYTPFKGQYSYTIGEGRKTRVFYQNLDELKNKLAVWSSVVLRQDCDDMPDLIESNMYFDMHPEQQKIYQTLEDDILQQLKSGEIVTPVDAGAKIIKLQQIASGFVRTEAGEYSIICENDPRTDMLINELKNTEGSVIVWCKFQMELRRVASRLDKEKISFVEYHGKVKQADRPKAIDSFQSGKAKVFLGQPKAGGHGLNLSKADTIIWYSHTFDLEERLQASERATAIAGKHVVVTNLVAVGSVDERILKSLEQKQEISDSVAGTGLQLRILGGF